jgi:hypothetical protein
VWVGLANDGPHFIISGTPRSGKTTALLSWILSLAQCHSPGQVQFVLVSGRRDSLGALGALPHVLSSFETADAFVRSGFLDRLSEDVARREGEGDDVVPRLVVALDDYEEFGSAMGSEIGDQMSVLATRGRTTGLHFLVAGALPDIGGMLFRDAFLKQLRIERSGLLLRVLDAGDQNPLGYRVRAAEIRRMVPGRGVLVRHGAGEVLQVVWPGDAAATVARLVEKWHRGDDIPSPPR